MWKDVYQSKLVSVEEAAKKVESNDKIWFGACSSAPIQLLEALADRYEEVENVDLVTGLALYPFKFFQSPKYIGHLNYTTIFYGAFERKFYSNGNINVNPIHLSETLNTARDVYHVDTLLADVSAPDEDGYMYYGPMGVSLNGEVAEFAKKIIVQVNKNQPKVSGFKHRIHVDDVDYICEHDHELPILPQPEVSETDKKIASIILPMIEDGSCIQIGLGGLSNAVGYGLDTKKDLTVHTEMFTDSMVYLAKKGVINGKMVAGFGLGSKELYEFVGEGKVDLAPINQVNNSYEVGKNDKFVSINACLMADLTGQVCSETLGHYMYSSTGGQLDYVKGAAISNGGQSFLCLPSVNKNKDGQVSSTITLNLPKGEIVTTPRSEVMYIVTEYGVADLRNQPVRERVIRMIAIAHPDFRESLHEQALEAGLIRE
ncbi:acetyl-CoA hydrolase/transferase C-terminal domain-containing protein [Vagococcus carniphilus]|uniref:Acetyl-CoA hydrolase/transferase C-terminal domain-containing protein n=1 Tax=Vagococcus carniphilus TaxID=218144 RepID=A0AAW8U9W7_9ENTE|nr:acetyl-CoA hydrolase/transferase C-terminal domain-containing protein [Vagococcus carniphilus]MDT2834519.1 acetyl-CoA hydrolase/transferase C-terminal domain-containing protein [Vagococcus carniphilus]